VRAANSNGVDGNVGKKLVDLGGFNTDDLKI